MRLIITPNAEKKIRFFQKRNEELTGFLIGSRIARFTIIKDLFAIDFDRNNFEKTYLQAYGLWSYKLKGFFFRKRNMFENEFMIGKIIMEIEDKTSNCYQYMLTGTVDPKLEKSPIKHIFM